MSKQSGVSNIIYGLLVIAILSAAIFGLTRLESTFDTELSDINTEVASISTSISSDPAISVGAAAETIVTTSPLCKIEIKSSYFDGNYYSSNSSSAYSLYDEYCTEEQIIASLFDGDGRTESNQNEISASFEDSACEDKYPNNNYVQISIYNPEADIGQDASISSTIEGFLNYDINNKKYSGFGDNDFKFQLTEFFNYNYCSDSNRDISFRFTYTPDPQNSISHFHIPAEYRDCSNPSEPSEPSDYIAFPVEQHLGKKLCIVW